MTRWRNGLIQACSEGCRAICFGDAYTPPQPLTAIFRAWQGFMPAPQTTTVIQNKLVELENPFAALQMAR